MKYPALPVGCMSRVISLVGIACPLAVSGYLVGDRTEGDHELVGGGKIVDAGETGNVEGGVRRYLDCVNELEERRLDSRLDWLSQGRERLEGGRRRCKGRGGAGVGAPYPAKNTRTNSNPIACRKG